jgi:PEGA domain
VARKARFRTLPAMAKTESTAVNNLIDLVSSNQRSSKPIVHPDDDLFATPGPAQPIRKMKTPAKAMPVLPSILPALPKPNAPARMTAPISTGAVPPLPRGRAPSGTAQHTLPEQLLRTRTAPPPRGNTIPPIPQRQSAPVFPPKGRMSEPRFTPSRPIATAEGTPPPERISPVQFDKATGAPINGVTATQFQAPAPTFPVMPQLSRIDMTGDAVLGENWFESSRAVEKFEDETYVGTSPHVKYERERSTTSLVKKLILPAIGFMVVGALIGGFIAFNGETKKKAATPESTAALVPAKPTAQNAALAASVAGGANTGVPVAKSVEAPNPAAEPAPAPTPTVQPSAPDVHDVQTTRGVVHLADVRIDSKPAGASVTLLDGDKRSFLGTTPLATSLDPSRVYQLELSMAGHPDQVASLDPSRTKHVQIIISNKAVKAAAPIVQHEVVAPKKQAPVHHAVAAKAAAPTDTLADPGFDSAPVEPKQKEKDNPVVATGTGTLMISAKPPCEILIDGKATGLSTPQRAMPLPAGAHKVTLVNSGANINKTVMVQINADQPTKLVKDFLAN